MRGPYWGAVYVSLVTIKFIISDDKWRASWKGGIGTLMAQITGSYTDEALFHSDVYLTHSFLSFWYFLAPFFAYLVKN
jgi:hypothetical protein